MCWVLGFGPCPLPTKCPRLLGTPAHTPAQSRPAFCAPRFVQMPTEHLPFDVSSYTSYGHKGALGFPSHWLFPTRPLPGLGITTHLIAQLRSVEAGPQDFPSPPIANPAGSTPSVPYLCPRFFIYSDITQTKSFSYFCAWTFSRGF